MVKYVGRHRRQPKWTPTKTVTSLAIITGFLAIPIGSGPQELKETKPEIVTFTTHESIIPPAPPPEPVNGGRADFEAWVNAGMPGYIPDSGGSKGVTDPTLNSELKVEPLIVTIQATCEREPAWNLGLSPNAAQVYEVICALFPQVTSFGGLRPGDSGDHGSGNAIDAMIDPVNGDALADWLVAHAGELPIKYIIWEQRIWQGNGWEGMDDRGSPTQNHYDHVHVSVY